MDIRITDEGYLKIIDTNNFKFIDLRERSLINQCRAPKTYRLLSEKIDDKYVYYLKLKNIDLEDNQIFDVLIEGKAYYVNRIIKKVENIKNTNYNCFLYRNKSGSLSLQVNIKINYINAEIETYNDKAEIKFLKNDIVCDYGNLILKKRVRKDLLLYCDLYVIKENIDIKEKIDFSIGDIEDLNDEQQWDFFLRVYTNNKYIDINIKPSNNINDEFKVFSKNELFINKIIYENNHLSIIVKRSKINPLKNIKIELKENIELSIQTSKDYKIVSCYLKARQNNNIKFCNLDSIKYDLVAKEGRYFIDKNIKKAILLPFNITVWDYWCSIINVNTGKISDLMLILNNNVDKTPIIEENYRLENYKTDIGSLTLRVTKYKTNYEKIRIGVYGSCFSRSAFQSTKFFNEDYKDKYEVVLTSFHTSIPSMTAKRINFVENEFEKYSDFKKNTIRGDFNKDFFYKLKQSNVDFLVIDLYADAVRPLIAYEDGSMITDTYILRQTDYIYKLGNPKIYSHMNLKEYLKLWEEEFEKFAECLEENFDTSKIIFQRARTAVKMKNKEGKLENFTPLEVLQSSISNSLFEYMELRFIKRFPKCEVIDIIKKNYIAFNEHPEGRSVSHYQSEYYKEFMHQLDKIILNKLKN